MRPPSARDLGLSFSFNSLKTYQNWLFSSPLWQGLATIMLFLMLDVCSPSAGTLEDVRKRGFVRCGVNGKLPGFSLGDSKGQLKGLDADYCRALSAAIFGAPDRFRFVPLTANERFTALQTGEVDVLFRNATWTLSRETTLGIRFGPIIYYDGQAFMVRKKMNVNSVEDLAGASVCLQQGTTTALNVADYFRSKNKEVESVIFEEEEGPKRAYESERCDAFTTERSRLIILRQSMSAPEEHIILPELISKEPYAPAVRKGDARWFNIVRWTHYALIQAEELGVTSKNIDEMRKSSNLEIQRLLSLIGEIGPSLGFSRNWVYAIIKNLGNYGELFSRNLGEESGFGLPRDLNALWTKGGLHYSPPFR